MNGRKSMHEVILVYRFFPHSSWLPEREPDSVLVCEISLGCRKIIKNFLTAVEFGVDDDINGEMVGNSAGVEDRRVGDENGTGGSSVEGAFPQDRDEKMNQDSSGSDLVPTAIPSVSMIASDEPYLGQEFESEAAAHAFYNAYATRVGFVIRVSKLSRSRRDGSAIGRALVCNKEGYRMPDKREKIVRQRAETRVGCRAMILVRKVSSGKWVVTKFVKEHSHPLTPGKGRRDCIYDQYPVSQSSFYLNLELVFVMF
jgi:hypothetical protein